MVELQEGPGRTVAGLFPPQSPGPPELHMGRSGPQEKGPLNWKLGLWKDSLPSSSSGTTWVLEVLPREPQRVGSSTIGKGATRAQALRGILGGLRVSSAHRAQG